jgi:20S proteasome alpha/beta subunit
MLWALSFVVLWAMAAGNKNFDAKGRVSQVEFAKDAVGLSTAAFGALCANGVLLATKRCVTRPTTSRWLKEEPRCVHRIDSELGAAVVGIPADCALAVAFLREAAGQHRSLFGEAMACQELADALAAYLHDLTLAGDTRPLAVEVLLASSSTLFRVDAGGSMQQVRL